MMETAYDKFLVKFQDFNATEDNSTQFNIVMDHVRSRKNNLRELLEKKKQQLSNIQIRTQPIFCSGKNNQSPKGRENSDDQMDLKKMQQQLLQSQIDQLKGTIRSFKEKRQAIQSQIQIFNSKEQQTVNALCECQKDTNESLVLLQKQKKQNKALEQKCEKDLARINAFKLELQEEIKGITQSIQEIDKNRQRKKTREKNVMSNKNVQPEIQPIYTKSEMQSSLRCLYMICKFRKLWLSQEKLKPQQLKEKLLKGLDIAQKIRFMSKQEIFQRYTELGCHINDDLIVSICDFYERLSSKFDRTERVHFQLTQTLIHVHKTDQQLNKSIQKIEANKTKDTIKMLQANDHNLVQLENKIIQTCKTILQFNLALQYITRKISSLNKTFDTVVRRIKTKRKIYKTFYSVTENFMINFQNLLERSPQDVCRRWNTHIFQSSNRSSTNSSSLNSKVDNKRQGEIYLSSIMKNDLLRILAVPQFYDHGKSGLENYQNTFDKVFDFEKDLIGNFSLTLTKLLQTPLKGVEMINAQLEKKQQLDVMISHTKVLPEKQAQINELFSQAAQFCVQSQQYYRRDNYKVLQKMERIQLKRKGLFYKDPFERNGNCQLLYGQQAPSASKNPLQKILDQHKLKASNAENRPKIRHNNLISQKRCRMGSQQKGIRKILEQISHIASSNYKYRIKKQRNTHKVSLNSSRVMLQCRTLA